MLVVAVHILVKEDYIDEFKEATLENAKQSLKEEGIARFDLLQEMNNPNSFMLYEVYKDPEDTMLHKETAHYNKWRSAVEKMMEKKRTSTKYLSLYPDNDGWN